MTIGIKAQIYTEANWWNTPPESWQLFAGADVAFPSTKMFADPAFGIHAGIVNTFGGYVKVVLNGGMKVAAHVADYSDYSYYMLKDGKAHHVFQAAMVGGMLRLWCPIYLNVGVGIGNDQISYELRNGEYLISAESKDSDHALGFEAGLTLRINNFMVGSGFMLFGGKNGAIALNASYCF